MEQWITRGRSIEFPRFATGWIIIIIIFIIIIII